MTSVTTLIDGVLSSKSLTLAQYEPSAPNNYFIAYRLVANVDGTYTITSVSSANTSGYLYNNTFSPQRMTANLIAQDDGSSGNLQFRMIQTLKAGQPYILVVSTANEMVNGSFSVSVDGPASISYSPFIPPSPSSILRIISCEIHTMLKLIYMIFVLSFFSHLSNSSTI